MSKNYSKSLFLSILLFCSSTFFTTPDIMDLLRDLQMTCTVADEEQIINIIKQKIKNFVEKGGNINQTFTKAQLQEEFLCGYDDTDNLSQEEMLTPRTFFDVFALSSESSFLEIFIEQKAILTNPSATLAERFDFMQNFTDETSSILKGTNIILNSLDADTKDNCIKQALKINSTSYPEFSATRFTEFTSNYLGAPPGSDLFYMHKPETSTSDFQEGIVSIRTFYHHIIDALKTDKSFHQNPYKKIIIESFKHAQELLESNWLEHYQKDTIEYNRIHEINQLVNELLAYAQESFNC